MFFLSKQPRYLFSFRRLIEKEVDELSPELPGILRSASVDVRLAASEAAAVCFTALKKPLKYLLELRLQQRLHETSEGPNTTSTMLMTCSSVSTIWRKEQRSAAALSNR